MSRIRRIVILKTRAKTRHTREMIDLMVESVRKSILDQKPFWEVCVLELRNVNGDNEYYAHVAILFLTMTCNPVYLAKKIKRLHQRGIMSYVISLMPEESSEFLYLFKQSGLAGITTYPFDPKQFVGQLGMLFISAGG